MEVIWLIVIVFALLLLGWAGFHLIAAIQHRQQRRKVLKTLQKSLDKNLE